MPKIIKIPLIAFACLFALALMLLAIVQTTWFKNYAAQKATHYLSAELGTTVSIGSIELSYFDALEACHIYIADQHSDTLIYIKTLQVDYDVFSFNQKEIRLNDVRINGGRIAIGVPKGGKELNIQFLVDYFSPPPSGKPTSSPTLIFDQVELSNTRFHYFNQNYAPPTSRAFDENNMVYSNLNGHLHNFEIINDSLTFYLDDISGTEKSGLIIEDLHARSIISSTTMEFTDFYLQTPHSVLRDYLRFSYYSYADFADFIALVNVDANLANSDLHTDDLALFSRNLGDYQETINGTGRIAGTIANMRSKKLQLALGDHTRYTGSASLIGLPNIDQTMINLKVSVFETNSIDLAQLIELNPAPQAFTNLGTITYRGTFIGLINDFKLQGDIGTDIGELITDLQYSQPPNTAPKYQGSFRSADINLQKLFNLEKLGSTSFDFTLDGQGLNTTAISAAIDGEVYHIKYNNYDYKNIVLNGSFSDDIFKGVGHITDPNFNLNFDGVVNLTEAHPTIDISTNILGINLKTLGLDSVDNVLRCKGDIDLKGNNIDNITGKIALDSFTLTRNETSYTINNVVLTASKTSEQRQYKLLSSVLNAAIEGDFVPTETETILAYIEHLIYPNQFNKPETTLATKDLRISATMASFTPLYAEFFKDLYFDRFVFDFYYDHQAGKLTSNSAVNGFKYDALSTANISINLKNEVNFSPINFSINTAGLKQNDSTIFTELDAKGYITNGEVHFETTAKQNSTLDLAIDGRFIYQNDSAMVYVDQSKVKIYDEEWGLRKSLTPNLIYHNGITELRSFDFRNGNQILYVEASTGYQADKINVILAQFQLDNLNPFIAGFNLKLQGTTNGYIDVSDRQGFPIIESDLTIDHLQLDNDTLGNLILTSKNKDLLAVSINGSITSGLLNDMKILGSIDFNHQNSPLNLQLLTQQSSIKPFEKYLNGLASGIDGYSTTDIKITGQLDQPKLNGTLLLDSLIFVVDYLRTGYTGSAVIDIDYNSFTLRSAQLVDRYEKKGRISGAVNHKNFSDFQFNLLIDQLENFEIMNTTRKDNNLFYGTVFVDGSMKIVGALDDILLQINAKSRKGTALVIPLDNFETSGNLSYVEFVNLKEDNNNLNQGFQTEAGVRMDFNIEITNDASVTLLFDELLGDKIEAAGHGNLRMEINTFGDFNMYGGLTIDRGNYLFTALNLINKYFTVKQGGTLFWDGSPYNAKINLEAIKREYPVPKTLMSGTAENPDQYNQAIPVDCYLKLTGLLFDPEVAFDLNFPTQNSLSGNATSALNTTIERIKLDQEELNRQVFALMVLGTFVPPSFATGSNYNALDGVENTGINSLSDFASSQLNNWLGKLDTRLQLGVDYQNSNQTDQAEIIVSMRRKFLEDRLELSASVDAAAQGSRPYDLTISYSITEDGNVRINGFQKQTADPTLGNLNSIQTAGVGLSFRHQFDKFWPRRKRVAAEKTP